MQAGSETRGGWPGIVLVWAIAIVGAVIVVSLAYGGTTDWFHDASALGVYGALGMVLAASVLGRAHRATGLATPQRVRDAHERERGRRRRRGGDRRDRGRAGGVRVTG